MANISPPALRVKGPAVNIPNGAIFNSSAANQPSYWYPDGKHGMFTYYFLMGLRGEADMDQDKKITVGELADYVQERVREKSLEDWTKEQQPTVVGDRSLILVER